MRRIGAVLVCLALLASAAGAQSGPRAQEGDWVGLVSFRGNDLPFRGGFEFSSVAGEVDGTFQWSFGPTHIGGVVSGPDTMPRFDLTTVSSGGVSIPDVSGGGEIQFTHASCERLEGIGVNIDVEQMGAVGVSEVVWWAVRPGTAADPAEFFEAFEALQTGVGDLIQSLEDGVRAFAGGGVSGRLESLITDAEDMATRLSRAESCGLEFYRSVIAAEVARILEFLLANPDVDVFTVGQILLTAVRAGVIGSGAESPDTDLEAAAHAMIADRIAAAAEAEDVVELELLSLIAEDAGWDDLSYEAIVALIRIGP